MPTITLVVPSQGWAISDPVDTLGNWDYGQVRLIRTDPANIVVTVSPIIMDGRARIAAHNKGSEQTRAEIEY